MNGRQNDKNNTDMRLSRLVTISRPVFWPILALSFLIGVAFGPGLGALTDIASPVRMAIMWLELVAVTFPLCVIAFGVNDIYDIASDEMNPRKGKATGAVLRSSERRSLLSAMVIAGISLAAIALAASIIIGDPLNIAVMLASIAVLVAYSAPPLRLKERPPLDSVANGLLWLGPFLLGNSFGAWDGDVMRKASVLCLAVAATHMYAAVVDYTPDKRAGHRTFAVTVGPRATSVVAGILLLIAIAFGGFSFPVRVLLAVGMCIFLFTAAVRPTSIERTAYYGAALLYLFFMAAGAFFLFIAAAG